ncbi:DNA-binding response regulator [Amylibacter marinus]|uniref:DNA-binding response regulator n=1 Tax=Amylibacter marinus TaxID=1475483 RepID=A0ABQ5VYJ4_9RHOB|nr:response regulator [Amylibacter marinus]GLQ36354.1 DNA-binding response regulator [Amylibacter marinus]
MPDTDLTVYLVDDDADIRTSLSRALHKRNFSVVSFASAAEFLASYDGDTQGCLLLDYGMNDMNGLELQRHLIDAGHHIPIIFITGHGGIAESVTAIKAGAVDFLEKPFRQQTLINCITSAFEQARLYQDSTRQAKIRQDRWARLTDREQEIARLMIANSASISSKDVGRTLDISPRTVDHHRARILEKMHVNSVTELVVIALRYNLVTNDDPA